MTILIKIREHLLELQATGAVNVQKSHEQQFPSWFVKKVFVLREAKAPEISKELFALASGTFSCALSYTACTINGVKFVSKS